VKATLDSPGDDRPAARRPDLPDLVLAAGAASLLAAVLFVLASPTVHAVRRSVTDSAIRGNAATVQLAVETWAAANLGAYPDDVHRVLPWLPHDRPPRNPVTGRPVEFRPAPGDVVYRPLDGGRGYVIEAFAQDAAPGPRVLLRLEGRMAADAPARAAL